MNTRMLREACIRRKGHRAWKVSEDFYLYCHAARTPKWYYKYRRETDAGWCWTTGMDNHPMIPRGIAALLCRGD
jgi:hypothetical protein